MHRDSVCTFTVNVEIHFFSAFEPFSKAADRYSKIMFSAENKKDLKDDD